MKPKPKLSIYAALLLGASVPLSAQDRTLFFEVDAPGLNKSVPTWGLDTAWLSDVNVLRGAAFMGREQVDVIRGSFTGDWPLVNGNLGPEALAELNERFRIVNTFTRPDTALYLNNDTGELHSSFVGVGGVEPFAWAQLIDATRREFAARGRTVVAVAPFNEPDYTTNQGGITRFGDVCWQLRNTFRANFDGIRLLGGNTLNNDAAAAWYDTLNGWTYLEEGNTHQLAGSFDTYAAFYQTVQANGDVGTNDELHNVMEAIVGVEYGMDVGIWWGSADYARGEFVKASDGMRLAYAEHRPNWTAAAVYRAPDGKVQAFVGESERQAQPTTYQFISKNRPVYFDGEGPQRTYTVTTTGGPTYWSADHRNAEKVVNITWGEDVQPAISGRYHLVARHSGKVMEVAGASLDNGGNIIQNSFTGATNQQWDVVPVPRTTGGDYSYHTIVAVHSGKAADITGFSLDNSGNVSQWPAVTGVNQQFVLGYVGDGWFTLRSKWSAKYVDVAGVSTADGANIHQWEGTGGFNQQWRLIPVGAAIEFNAPAAPVGLVATANPASVSLAWSSNTEADLAGYNVYRATDLAGPYEMIARGVGTSSYTDESATQPADYFYKIKAVDRSLNRSEYSETVVGSATGVDALVAHHSFEATLNDLTANANRATVVGATNYVAGPVSGRAIALDGANYLTLPATVANHEEFSFAAWVYWTGGADWQRIFDFGNGIDNNLFLTPRAGGAGLRFGFMQNGVEQQINAPALATNRWVHVAVTLAPEDCRVYVDGALVGSLAATLRPSDIAPVMNYLGKSQWPDPLFSGALDDVRVYNHAIDSTAVSALFAGANPSLAGAVIGTTGSFANDPATTRSAARDGNPATFFDAADPSSGWVGVDLGHPHVISQIRYLPRANFAWRMVGGAFQASSTPDFSSDVTTLHTIPSTPLDGSYTQVPVANTTARYVRYFGPAGAHCNIAELVVQGVITLPNVTAGLTASGGTGQITLNWASASGAASYNVKRAVLNGGPYSLIGNVTSTGYTDSGLASGATYYYVVSAVNAAGESANSNQAAATTAVLLPPPAPWASADIGSVGVAGSASFASGVYTIAGSGADIWDTADAFRYVSQTLNGDGEIRARVTSQTNTDPFAKAGVMIRDGVGAGAVNALVSVTPGSGFTFQWRSAASGFSTFVPGPATNSAPNNWVRLVRSGSLFTAYVSGNGTTWTQVGTTTLSIAQSATVGLAVTSHNNSALSTATFDNVTVTPYPSPWVSADVGATGLTGAAEFFGGAHTLKGAGTFGGRVDGFRFAYQTLSADGSIIARVNTLQNTGTNSRVGVMIRDTMANNARMVALTVSDAGAWRWQRRTTTGGTMSTTNSSTGTAPNLWVRLVRTGNTITASRSTNGTTWTTIGSTTVTMASNCYVGLAIASGSTTTLNTSVFDNVTVVP